MEIPPDIVAEMPVPSTPTSRSGQRRNSEIGSARPGTRAATSNHEKGIHLGDIVPGGPPDLMQSVEDVYRSFISDGHRTNVLPTPRSETGGFHFSGDEWERGRRATVMSSPIISPDGYAAHHAKRFAELGYCQSLHFLPFMC